MKTILYSIGLFILSLLSVSCERNLMEYEGEEGIYFAVRRGAYVDSTEWAYQFFTPVEFVRTVKDEITVNLRVMITGPVKNYDRPFGLVMVPDSTTAIQGINYDKLPAGGVIKAKCYYTDIPVTVKRAENIQEEQKVLTFRLVPNEYFTLSIPV